MDSAKAFLALLTIAAVAGPGTGLTFQMMRDKAFALQIADRMTILCALALVFLCLRQAERVLHLKREDQLDRRWLAQAAQIQFHIAEAISGKAPPAGTPAGGWEDVVYGLFRGKGRGGPGQGGQIIESLPDPDQ